MVVTQIGGSYAAAPAPSLLSSLPESAAAGDAAEELPPTTRRRLTHNFHSEKGQRVVESGQEAPHPSLLPTGSETCSEKGSFHWIGYLLWIRSDPFWKGYLLWIRSLLWKGFIDQIPS